MGVGKDMTNGELGGFFKTMHCPKCPYNREHWDNCNKVDQVSQLFFSRIVGKFAKKSNFENFESALCSTSANMSLIVKVAEFGNPSTKKIDRGTLLCVLKYFNGSQLAKIKKSIPHISMQWNL